MIFSLVFYMVACICYFYLDFIAIKLIIVQMSKSLENERKFLVFFFYELDQFSIWDKIQIYMYKTVFGELIGKYNFLHSASQGLLST